MSDNKADPKTSVRPDGGGNTVVPEKELQLPKIRPHTVEDVVQDASSGAPSTNNPGQSGPFSKE